MRKGQVVLFILILSVTIVVTGCSSSSQVSNQQDDLKLEVGIMPAVDSAPILVAQKQGYFEELGLDLNLNVYTNAVKRQSALQTGELDGAMTDLIALVNNVDNGFAVQVTTSTDGSFPVLVNQEFTKQQEVEIGMMEVSVSNFLAEQYLAEEYKLNKTFISEIPARLEMVKAGKMDMAVIPEPMASMGQLKGLDKKVYDNQADFMPEAMIFTENALQQKEKAVQLFHQAYNQAVADIEANDDLAREVLIEELDLKPAIKEKIVLPDYHQTRVPDQEYMTQIIEWVEKVQNTKLDVEYEEMIERKFVD